MKLTTWAIGAVLLAACAGRAQTPAPDDERARRAEIEAKIKRGAPITGEERKYLEKILQRRNVEWAKTHPAHDSLGFAPLIDLGTGTYKGEQGGLYAGGTNQHPPAHLNAGIKIARSIRPLDGEGRESPDGKIVLVSTGMSNTRVESEVFAELLQKASGVNPKLLFVDCAQSGGDGAVTSNPVAPYWRVAEKTLAAAGVTPKQVQIAWIKQTIGDRHDEFPDNARKLRNPMVATVHNLHNKYPNLKIAYVSTRIYAGYAKSPLSPEPYAYEDGFGMKWFIASQISGDAELNYDPANGAVQSPWIAWGPYLWADGVKARSDGLTYVADDFIPGDRTHPSDSGRQKVARQLLDFLERDPTATPWFLSTQKDTR